VCSALISKKFLMEKTFENRTSLVGSGGDKNFKLRTLEKYSLL